MAATTVFVDDAVQGNLPPVCAKTGAPTSKRLTIHQDLTGGLGAAWVLVFFGPLGWLVLLLVAASRRRSTLTVRIPYASDRLDTYVRTARRTIHLALGTGAGLLLVVAAHYGKVFTAPAASMIAGLAVLVVGGIAVIVNGTIARRMLVGISLDASGRWVTLRQVHPAFAAACEAAKRTPADRPVPGRQPI